jgi:hypothetical protein
MTSRAVGWQTSVAFCLVWLGVNARAEAPVRVNSCQLKRDPAAYNHKLVEVTAFVSHGFEDFTLFDPACPSYPPIWLEYGGSASSGTVYCCGVGADRSREAELQIEDIPVPLVNDERYQEFDRLVQRRPDSLVRGTIVGRFYSGQSQIWDGRIIWGGYGHMGCCSLLAIQQVLNVDPQKRTDLDYRASPDQPDSGEVGCSVQFLTSPEQGAGALDAQRQAEAGNTDWAFTYPQRVASVALAKLLSVDPKSVVGMRLTRRSPARISYVWKPKGSGRIYTVQVSRLYWLSFYAKDAAKVAWVIIGAYESSCSKTAN